MALGAFKSVGDTFLVFLMESNQKTEYHRAGAVIPKRRSPTEKQTLPSRNVSERD